MDQGHHFAVPQGHLMTVFLSQATGDRQESLMYINFREMSADNNVLRGALLKFL